MSYIKTVPPADATGLLRELYDDDLEEKGYIGNHTQALSLRPEAENTWRILLDTIQSKLDPRRYELITIAAAAAVRSTYCTLGYGSRLRSTIFSAAEVAAIARDFRNAGLAANEVALMAYAEKVARAAHSVTREDIEGLRAHGITDEEILDTALTAAVRCFYGKVMDAVGAIPDDVFLELEPELREALVVGRPFPAG